MIYAVISGALTRYAKAYPNFLMLPWFFQHLFACLPDYGEFTTTFQLYLKLTSQQCAVMPRNFVYQSIEFLLPKREVSAAICHEIINSFL